MKKIWNIMTAAAFVCLLFGFAVAFWIVPDQSFSEQENRSLRTLPKFTWEKLVSGEYSAQINDYFADQFPLRDGLVGVKGFSELLLGKGENNGILLGKDGQLAQRSFDLYTKKCESEVALDTFDPDTVLGAVDGINRVSQTLDVPFTALLTGRTVDVAGSAFAYPTDASNELLTLVRENMEEGTHYLETVPLLREKYDAGEYVYYKTDHHWTTLGAYYAYAETMRSFGMEDEIIPADAFLKETVSDAFYGTAWSAGGMKHVAPDSMEFWLLGNEDEFTVTADGKEIDGMYSRSYLAKKDKYSAFLDGTHNVVTVRKNTDEARPTLLILRDSFASSLAPFLAQHFDLVLLNLSSATADYTDVTSAVNEYGADRVLLVYTLENVVTTKKLHTLR